MQFKFDGLLHHASQQEVFEVIYLGLFFCTSCVQQSQKQQQQQQQQQQSTAAAAAAAVHGSSSRSWSSLVQEMAAAVCSASACKQENIQVVGVHNSSAKQQLDCSNTHVKIQQQCGDHQHMHPHNPAFSFGSSQASIMTMCNVLITQDHPAGFAARCGANHRVLWQDNNTPWRKSVAACRKHLQEAIWRGLPAE
jgi:hypothetical protein